MRKLRLGAVPWCAVAGLLFAEKQLKAYADPGSGALVWQMLVGAFFGGFYLLRRAFVRFAGRKANFTKQ